MFEETLERILTADDDIEVSEEEDEPSDDDQKSN